MRTHDLWGRMLLQENILTLSRLLCGKILGVRARYEKELRGLHEDKNRSEEEIRQQLRDEKVRRIKGTGGKAEAAAVGFALTHSFSFYCSGSDQRAGGAPVAG